MRTHHIAAAVHVYAQSILITVLITYWSLTVLINSDINNSYCVTVWSISEVTPRHIWSSPKFSPSVLININLEIRCQLSTCVLVLVYAHLWVHFVKCKVDTSWMRSSKIWTPMPLTITTSWCMDANFVSVFEPKGQLISCLVLNAKVCSLVKWCFCVVPHVYTQTGFTVLVM